MMRALLLIVLAVAMPAAAKQNDVDKHLERMMSGGPMLDPPELAAAITKADAHPLGSANNPVRAARPEGQRAYLKELRCADGRAPAFERRGNVGPGVFMSIVDLYLVDCGAAAPGRVEIRMDMYHPGHVEKRPVPGFTVGGPTPDAI